MALFIFVDTTNISKQIAVSIFRAENYCIALTSLLQLFYRPIFKFTFHIRRSLSSETVCPFFVSFELLTVSQVVNKVPKFYDS